MSLMCQNTNQIIDYNVEKCRTHHPTLPSAIQYSKRLHFGEVELQVKSNFKSVILQKNANNSKHFTRDTKGSSLNNKPLVHKNVCFMKTQRHGHMKPVEYKGCPDSDSGL